jgi:cytidyltransferase-like protein
MTESQALPQQDQQQQAPKQQVKVFVSGCYDILHGGHLEFWSQARALGTYLIVSFASDGVLAAHKANRRSSIPTEHKKQLIGGSAMLMQCHPAKKHSI